MSRKQKLEDAARLIDSADALWEGFPDTNFLYERIKHYEGSEKLLLEDETCWKRAVIDLLRSNIPLREHTRRLLAGDLEKAWFESPRESARKHRQFLASVYEQLIAWSVEGGRHYEAAGQGATCEGPRPALHRSARAAPEARQA